MNVITLTTHGEYFNGTNTDVFYFDSYNKARCRFDVLLKLLNEKYEEDESVNITQIFDGLDALYSVKRGDTVVAYMNLKENKVQYRLRGYYELLCYVEK